MGIGKGEWSVTVVPSYGGGGGNFLFPSSSEKPRGAVGLQFPLVISFDDVEACIAAVVVGVFHDIFFSAALKFV